VSRAKLFVGNFFIYGLGSVLTKIVPFLMLPILTRMITDPAIFGVFDIYTIIIRLCEPIVLLGGYDAMFRLFFDDEDVVFRKSICSNALLVVATTSAITIFSAFVAWLSNVYSGEYSWMILSAGIAIAVNAIQTIVSAPTRMENRRRTFILLSLVGPIFYYSSAVIFSLQGYPLEGLALGNILSIVLVLSLYAMLNCSWFSIKNINKKNIKELLIIGTPLVPSILVMWIFNSCDRFMIGKMISLEAVGIYGIGAKLAAISQGIYMAFAGGWQFFAFSTMKDKDHAHLLSHTYEILSILSILSLAVILPWIDIFFNAMVGGVYSQAAIVFPFLYISPLLLMLSQISGTQLMVVKKPHLTIVFRLIGAVSNIVLNAIFIPHMGILGAAMGTAMSYIIMTTLITHLAVRMDLFFVEIRLIKISICATALLFLYPFAKNAAIIASYFLIFIIIIAYRNYIFSGFKNIYSRRVL